MMGLFKRFREVIRQDTALFVQAAGDDEVVGTQLSNVLLQVSHVLPHFRKPRIHLGYHTNGIED
jgi:hypothetical protein